MVFQIDLKRNPAVADLISEMSMGEGVCFRTSLKSKSDNLAEFTLEKAMEVPDDMKDDDSDDEESDSEAEEDGDEERKHSRMPAPGGSQNTPGGSVEQDRMAAALSAQI